MASFNGTKESCPNWDETSNKLSIDWGQYPDADEGDPTFDNSSFQETCFEICGKGKYIENGECRSCPSDFYDTSGPPNINSDYENAAFVEMCDHKSSDRENGIPIWFVRQQDANLSREIRDRIDWSSASSRLETDQNSEAYKFNSIGINMIED